MNSPNDVYRRSMFKPLSYRIVGAFLTALIVFALTHRLALSITVGALSLVAKIILWYLHEKCWARIASEKDKT